MINDLFYVRSRRKIIWFLRWRHRRSHKKDGSVTPTRGRVIDILRPRFYVCSHFIIRVSYSHLNVDYSHLIICNICSVSVKKAMQRYRSPRELTYHRIDRVATWLLQFGVSLYLLHRLCSPRTTLIFDIRVGDRDRAKTADTSFPWYGFVV